MTLVWGATLAVGILLILAPRWWPARRTRVARRDSRTTELLAGAGFARAAPSVLYLICAAAALLAGAAAWLATSVPVIAVAATVAGAGLPVVWLRGRRRSMRKARRMLWPDVCDLLIASVRSGLSLPDAVASLRGSAPPALRAAFAGFAVDLAASGHVDSSLDRLKATLADPVADRIFETLRMAREVGGTELVPVLRSLAAAVRAETGVRAEAESRQSWVRGAAILGVVAPWIVLFLLAMRPEGARAYSSPEGVVLIAVSVVVSVVAFRLMLRIGRLPEQRRWFG